MSSFTDKTLAQQLHVTPLEIKTRLAALGIDHDVCAMLQKYLPWIQEAAEGIVEEIYEELLSSSEVARLIGDAESLRRTKSSLVHYLCTFFEAKFDEKYVLTRLRVGQVHKRIGVEPKYFMAGVKALCEKLPLQ